ncbi:unnamed protein product [Gadus morhua 'NCC']
MRQPMRRKNQPPLLQPSSSDRDRTEDVNALGQEVRLASSALAKSWALFCFASPATRSPDTTSGPGTTAHTSVPEQRSGLISPQRDLIQARLRHAGSGDTSLHLRPSSPPLTSQAEAHTLAAADITDTSGSRAVIGVNTMEAEASPRGVEGCVGIVKQDRDRRSPPGIRGFWCYRLQSYRGGVHSEKVMMETMKLQQGLDIWMGSPVADGTIFPGSLMRNMSATKP